MNLKDFLYGRAQDVLKRWSRSGVEEFISEILKEDKFQKRKMLVVGGYGRVMTYINKTFPNDDIMTLDVNADFKPDITADLSASDLVEHIEMRFDVIIVVEVLEHISNFSSALKNMNTLLNNGGVLIGTTPWSTPLHDKPFDFYRYSYYQIQEMLLKHAFSNIKLECRGNLLDSIIYLGLRGLKSWGIKGKLTFLVFAPISLLMRKPKRYRDIQDSCLGYNFAANKF